jgi:hypothetical protein
MAAACEEQQQRHQLSTVTPVVVIVAFASGNCSLPTIQNYYTNVFDLAFIYR